MDNFTVSYLNITEEHLGGKSSASVPDWYESGRIQIPLYAIIFLLAVIGNVLVILTLVSKNKHCFVNMQFKRKTREGIHSYVNC